MKRAGIIIIGILILIGCKEQKEKIIKLIFDASKMSNQINYLYIYDSNKLICQIEKTYTIEFGQVVDSFITKTKFEYNNKGLLFKEISETDSEEKPSVKIYNYDKDDSLISKISINPENDTTFWEVYEYYPDGRKTIFHRFLSLHLDSNIDFIKAIENKKMDTSFYRNEFEYVDGLCKIQKQFDKKKNLIKIINFDYDKTHLVKETHLNYFKGIAVIEKKKFYDYTKSQINPDYYSLDSKNDTIETGIYTFDSEKNYKTVNTNVYGKLYHEEYYENGLLIGRIDCVKQFNMYKIIYVYEYNKEGILKTEKIYRE